MYLCVSNCSAAMAVLRSGPAVVRWLDLNLIHMICLQAQLCVLCCAAPSEGRALLLFMPVGFKPLRAKPNLLYIYHMHAALCGDSGFDA
jgi:hypothetical protein